MFSLNRNNFHISKSMLHKWVQVKHNKHLQKPDLIWGKGIAEWQIGVADFAFPGPQLLGFLPAYCIQHRQRPE